MTDFSAIPTDYCRLCHAPTIIGETAQGEKIKLDKDPHIRGVYFVGAILDETLAIARSGAPNFEFGKVRMQPHVLTCAARS